MIPEGAAPGVALPVTVRLDGLGPAWEPLTLPDSRPGVRRAVLHAAGGGGASVQAVDFPPGWRREPAGHFLVDEEFVVLRGWLQLSDVVVRAGEHAVVPAGAVRADSSAGPGGCLAVAWFGGVPRWHPGPGPAPAAAVASRPLEGVQLADGGRLRPYPAAEVVGPSDVVTTDGRWTWVPDGATMATPDAVALVRRWARS